MLVATSAGFPERGACGIVFTTLCCCIAPQVEQSGCMRLCIADNLMLLCRMQNGRKTRSERLEVPLFSTVIEIRDRHTWLVHPDVAASVDSILNGQAPATLIRQST